MKFSALQKNLLPAIKIAKRASKSKSGLQALTHLLLETGDGCMNVSGTDLELYTTVRVGAKVAMPGMALVPAKGLLEIIEVFPKERIDFDLIDNLLHINCKDQYFSLPCMNPDEFFQTPTVHKQHTISIDAAAFKTMVDSVAFAAGEIFRFRRHSILDGVYTVAMENLLTMVASNRYRLAWRKHYLHSEAQFDCVIPPRPLKEIARLVKKRDNSTVEITISKKRISLEYTPRFGLKTVVTHDLIEGTYPQWERVIPETHAATTIVNRLELLEIAKQRYSKDDDFPYLTLKPRKGNDNAYSLNMRDTLQLLDQHSALYELHAKFVETGGTLTQVSLHIPYLIDALKAIDTENVVILSNDRTSGVILRPFDDDSHLHFIIPVNLDL